MEKRSTDWRIAATALLMGTRDDSMLKQVDFIFMGVAQLDRPMVLD